MLTEKLMRMVNKLIYTIIWVQEAPTDALGVAPLAVLDGLGHVVAAVPGQRVMQIPTCHALNKMQLLFS